MTKKIKPFGERTILYCPETYTPRRDGHFRWGKTGSPEFSKITFNVVSSDLPSLPDKVQETIVFDARNMVRATSGGKPTPKVAHMNQPSISFFDMSGTLPEKIILDGMKDFYVHSSEFKKDVHPEGEIGMYTLTGRSVHPNVKEIRLVKTLHGKDIRTIIVKNHKRKSKTTGCNRTLDFMIFSDTNEPVSNIKCTESGTEATCNVKIGY